MAYKKLTSKRLNGIVSYTNHTLWQGDDHLLLVEKQSFSESYRRFAYKDIESITIFTNKKQGWFSIAFGILTLVFLVMALSFMTSNSALAYFLGAFATFFTILFISNQILGKTCKLFINTLVQSTPILSIRRQPKALKFITKLTPIIEKVQGELNEDAHEVLADDFSYTKSDDIKPNTTQSKLKRPPVLLEKYNQYKGKWHNYLWICLLASACTTLAGMFFRNRVISVFYLCVFGVLIFSLIAALSRQGKSRLPSLIKNITWASFWVQLVYSINSYAFLMYGIVKYTKTHKGINTNNPFWMADAVNKVSPFKDTYALVSYSIPIMTSLIFAAILFTNLKKYQANISSPPPIPKT